MYFDNLGVVGRVLWRIGLFFLLGFAMIYFSHDVYAMEPEGDSLTPEKRAKLETERSTILASLPDMRDQIEGTWYNVEDVARMKSTMGKDEYEAMLAKVTQPYNESCTNENSAMHR